MAVNCIENRNQEEKRRIKIQNGLIVITIHARTKDSATLY